MLTFNDKKSWKQTTGCSAIELRDGQTFLLGTKGASYLWDAVADVYVEIMIEKVDWHYSAFLKQMRDGRIFISQDQNTFLHI